MYSGHRAKWSVDEDAVRIFLVMLAEEVGSSGWEL